MPGRMRPRSIPYSALPGRATLRSAGKPVNFVQKVEVVRFFVLGLSLGLAGCAASHLAESLSDPPVSADLAAPDYRQIVADNIAAVFPNSDALGPMEISPARPDCPGCDHHFQPANHRQD